jgi:cell wall-associated NlpC family hydrolase
MRIVVIALAAMTSACASTGAVPKPFPAPAPHASPSPLDGSRGSTAARRAGETDPDALVGTALTLRGVPYRNGGSDPEGFDCSGFTQYVFAQHGILLPREVREQYSAGRPVAAREIRPGDLVFFTTTGPRARASHVAIAIGGDEFVHAPSSTGVVRVERLSATYWSKRYVGTRRVD